MKTKLAIPIKNAAFAQNSNPVVLSRFVGSAVPGITRSSHEARPSDTPSFFNTSPAFHRTHPPQSPSHTLPYFIPEASIIGNLCLGTPTNAIIVSTTAAATHID